MVEAGLSRTKPRSRMHTDGAPKAPNMDPKEAATVADRQQ